MRLSRAILLLGLSPLLMAFTPGTPGQRGVQTDRADVISTCATPAGLRSLNASGLVAPEIHLIRSGSRYDLEFSQGPLGTWRLSDGGAVRQAGTPQQFLQLAVAENQFLYAAKPNGTAVLNWLGPNGKQGKAACIAKNPGEPAQEQQASGY